MHEERLVRPDVRDGAHEVRAFGNDMAYGDFIQHVTSDEADLVLAEFAPPLTTHLAVFAAERARLNGTV